MKKIDARGLECPKPVILTKIELDAMEEGEVETTVDNEVAKENLKKLAESLACEFSFKKEGEFYICKIKKVKGCRITEKEDSLVLGIGTDVMGHGDEKLGKLLMKSFMYTVRETGPLPKSICFFNGGVRLTCEGSEVLDDIKALSDNGVEIISCGTCLDYYNIKDRLKVGEISNMYTIYEKLKDSDRNIILS